MNKKAGISLHPWNTGFEWTNHAGPFRRVTEAQARAYDEDGYFVLEHAVDPADIAALTEAIEPFDREVMEFLATQPDGRFSIAGVDTVSIALHPAARSAVCRDFCTSELMADLGHDLIGPDVRLYWDQSVFKRPHGTEPVLWHQDNGYTYVEPQAYLTVWVALTDATPGERLYLGPPRYPSFGHGRASQYADRVRVRCRSRGGCASTSERRRCGRLQLTHPTRDRVQPNRRATQGVHRAVRPGRCGRVARRSRGRPAHGTRRARRSPPSVPHAVRLPRWFQSNAPDSFGTGHRSHRARRRVGSLVTSFRAGLPPRSIPTWNHYDDLHMIYTRYSTK